MKNMTALIVIAFVTLSTAACGSNGTLPSGTADTSQRLIDISTAESAENTTHEGSSTKDIMESADKQSKTVTRPYAAGDIILANGTAIKAEDLTSVDGSNLPIAVVAELKDDGTALGVGVHRSTSPLQWAADATTGCTTMFLDIVSTQDESVFIGDTDGADNWSVISASDSQGAVDAAENYPAFNFANTYAVTCNLQGDYASGWYMPSITELCTIYENREVINSSLRKIFELDENAAMDGLETNWYWSSSQAGSSDDYAWFVHYFNGYAGECPKNFTNVHALAVRIF